jgi:hypothetical protein
MQHRMKALTHHGDRVLVLIELLQYYNIMQCMVIDCV